MGLKSLVMFKGINAIDFLNKHFRSDDDFVLNTYYNSNGSMVFGIVGVAPSMQLRDEPGSTDVAKNRKSL